MKDALELEREDERLKALHASVTASVEKQKDQKELEAGFTLKFSRNRCLFESVIAAAWLYFWTRCSESFTAAVVCG